ncbi:MAG: 4-alpha-glucanotransferase, partial [Muribaculaceae bacterium]|nr:4-alpha-glucanotransferase [Muribaculaceae bacterium]
ALHPMYIRLEAVGKLKNASDIKHYNTIREELNKLPEVDYERVNKAKTEYLKKLFVESGEKTLKLKKYKEFVDKNSFWLKPYATFRVLRDKNGTVDYKLWGDMATYNPEKVDDFISKNTEDINFIYFLQYHLDKQLREVRDYAHAKGVVLKGDIPIGISRTSVDAWANPRLFNLDCQAGAPPDDFSISGQNWGFPTYNWEEMSKDGYQWWKDRFAKMAEYFDAYRIDHILGFFRIWEIPMEAVHGLLGRFNPALPYSTDEMRRKYEFCMNPDLYTRPYIMDWFLSDIFGEYTEEVKNNFMIARGNGRYDLHPKFATQRQVVNYFNTLEPNEKNSAIRDSLLRLIEDVLFIEDKSKKSHYHPRICAQNTYIYKS